MYKKGLLSSFHAYSLPRCGNYQVTLELQAIKTNYSLAIFIDNFFM